jgi:hypothetical protein
MLPNDKDLSKWQLRKVQKVPYLEAVGALFYLANGTCLDLSFATGLVGCFAKNPNISHWNCYESAKTS